MQRWRAHFEVLLDVSNEYHEHDQAACGIHGDDPALLERGVYGHGFVFLLLRRLRSVLYPGGNVCVANGVPMHCRRFQGVEIGVRCWIISTA